MQMTVLISLEPLLRHTENMRIFCEFYKLLTFPRQS